MQQVPVQVVGSSVFGRYPKINSERTFNMYISDGWLVNYAGFKKRVELREEGACRAVFHSVINKLLVVVIGNEVFKVTEALGAKKVGNLQTSTTEVTMDQNLGGQICIVDGLKAYIYNPNVRDTFTVQNLAFSPNYVVYHNTYFLLTSGGSNTDPAKWYVYQPKTSTPDTAIEEVIDLALQTKPDKTEAVIRVPGHGNNILVFGSSVAELWTQVPTASIYQRASSINIDYGCISSETIAANSEYVCWLGINEANSPVLMAFNGSQTMQISTDGIDNVLRQVQYPSDSTAFFYKLEGHLFYQLTFYNAADNFTLVYDFTEQKFFNITDEDSNYHPARRVVYFGSKTYFVSLNDASLYEMGTQFTEYNYNIAEGTTGETIPRSSICNTIRLPDSSRFRVHAFKFWLEQGYDENYQQVGQAEPPIIDFSFSKNGNASFGNKLRSTLNVSGKYRNQITFHRLGIANEFTPKLEFWGHQRFVAKDGVLEIF